MPRRPRESIVGREFEIATKNALLAKAKAAKNAAATLTAEEDEAPRSRAGSAESIGSSLDDDSEPDNSQASNRLRTRGNSGKARVEMLAQAQIKSSKFFGSTQSIPTSTSFANYNNYYSIHDPIIKHETCFFETVHVRQALDFLTEPSSSPNSWKWNGFLTFLVLVRIALICTESVDGPNQYHGREDKAKFGWLFDKETYWILECVVLMPILLDNAARFVTICCIYFLDRNYHLKEMVVEDTLKLNLIYCDLIGTLPFIVHCLHDPNTLGQAPRILLRTMEVLSVSKIMRITRDIKAIYATRVAVSKAAPHLVLPIFFFIVINVTAAVILYFLEPCYDETTCPWKSMFDACFFAVISMSTVGYGNQVPQFEIGRLVTCCLILLGVLFICMPLALIGNEFARVKDNTTTEKLIRKRQERVAMRRFKKHEASNDSTVDDLMVDDEYDKSAMVKAWRYFNESAAALVDTKDDDEISYSAVLLVAQVKCSIRPMLDNLDSFSERFKQVVKLMLPSEVADDDDDDVRDKDDRLLDKGDLAMPLTTAAVQIIKQASVGAIVRKLSSGFVDASKIAKLREVSGQDTNMTKPQNAKENMPDGVALTARTARTIARNTRTAIVMPQSSRSRLNSPAPKIEEEVEGFNDDDDDDDDAEEGVEGDEGNDGGEKRTAAELRKAASSGTSSAMDEAIPRSNTASPAVTDTGTVTKATPTLGMKTATTIIRMTKVRKIKRQLVPRTPSFGSGRAKISSDADTHTNDQLTYVLAHMDDPRCRVFLLMEYPKFNFASRAIQMVLIIFIIFSILLLFTETLTSFQDFSESGDLCGKVLKIYCSDKTDNGLDSGCFHHIMTDGVLSVTDDKLQYNCHDDNCFAEGVNFGTGVVSCSNSNLPFQDKESLRLKYGYPSFFTSRYDFSVTENVCTRIECMEDPAEYDGNKYWVPFEFLVNGIFTLELFLRLYGTVGSASYFFTKWLNWFDIAALIPFYVEGVLPLIMTGSLETVDFGILASAPVPIILIAARSLKVVRLFKLLRHFTASKVLLDTARLGWKEMAAIVGMLIFFTIVFAIICFELEKGEACYVGDEGCEAPEDLYLSDGSRVVLDKFGDGAKISNVYFGIWFSFVTLTSTGYGDIVPVTNIGQLWTVFLILWGAIYMSMPLTVAASTFSYVHDKYERCHGRISDEELGNKATVEDFQVHISKSGIARQLHALDANCRTFFDHLEDHDGDMLAGTGGRTDRRTREIFADIIEDSQRVVPNMEDILEKYVRASLAVRAMEISVGNG